MSLNCLELLNSLVFVIISEYIIFFRVSTSSDTLAAEVELKTNLEVVSRRAKPP